MVYSQSGRVECQVTPVELLRGTISDITDQRKAAGSKLHANLMRTTCLQGDRHEGRAFQLCHRIESQPGLLARWMARLHDSDLPVHLCQMVCPTAR